MTKEAARRYNLPQQHMQLKPDLAADHPTYKRWRWQIFAITWLSYAGYYLTRKSFSVAKIALGPGTAIGLTKGQMAGIDTAFSVAYALGQFIFGLAGDKLGTRRVILLGMLGSVAVAATMGTASGALAFGVLFCLQGLCQATGWAPLTKNISNFFSTRERGMVMGFWCTNYAVGGMLATVYAGYVGKQFGWRFAFFIPAATLLVIWVLFLLFQRNRPEDLGLPPIEEYHCESAASVQPPAGTVTVVESIWPTVWTVATNPVVLLLCLAYFCLKPARYLFLFWGPQYIHERLGSGMAASSVISSAFEFGGPLGALLGGWLSDKLFGSRRMPVAVISLFMLTVLLLFFYGLPAQPWIIAGALFVMGAFTYAADSLINGTAAVDFGTKKGASTAAGLINGVGSVGQILGPAIPGILPASWGWGGVFALLAGACLLSGLILLPKWKAMPPSAA